MNDSERRWMSAGREIADRFKRHREYREQVLDAAVRASDSGYPDREQLRFEIALWLAAGDRIIEESDRWRDRK